MQLAIAGPHEYGISLAGLGSSPEAIPIVISIPQARQWMTLKAVVSTILTPAILKNRALG